MKTTNSLLCVAVVALLLGIIMPVYGVDSYVTFEKRAYAAFDADNIDTFWVGDSLLLLDCCTDKNGGMWGVFCDLATLDIYYIYCGTEMDNVYSISYPYSALNSPNEASDNISGDSLNTLGINGNSGMETITSSFY
ncbi:MAG: hypothetical protein ACYSWO_08990 [Planctomycetota bacterium]|jgi:hypothetical protein